MYRLTSNGSVVRDDGLSIPANEGNRDYQEYLAWRADGGIPEGSSVDPVEVPAVVSRFQACAALLGAGLLDAVEAFMASPDTPRMAKLAWSTAQEFRRRSPLVAQLGGMLGLDDAALDTLFITAAGIEA